MSNVISQAIDLLRRDGYAEMDSCKIGHDLWKCPDCERDESGRCVAQRMNGERFQIIQRLDASRKKVA